MSCTCYRGAHRSPTPCPTCARFAAIALGVALRSAQRAVELQALAERDWRDRVDERLGRIETALARVGVV